MAAKRRRPKEGRKEGGKNQPTYISGHFPAAAAAVRKEGGKDSALDREPHRSLSLCSTVPTQSWFGCCRIFAVQLLHLRLEVILVLTELIYIMKYGCP